MLSSVSTYPPVGIGILNWNGQRYLEKFLEPFYRISYPDFQLYVIDNNSSDGSVDYLQQNHPRIKIISTGDNHGFAGGYNIGFKQMPEKYLLMINSDVAVTTGFLEPLVKLMESDEAIAVCQSKILAYNDKRMFEYGGAAGGMIDILGYSFCRGRIFDTVEEDKGQYKTSDVFWAGGACALIRKSAYVKAGGMYPYFFMHFEEIDLCWRMHAEKYRVLFCNESVVYHVGGGTLTYQSPRKTYYNFRNNLVMVVKNSGPLFLFWWLPVRLMVDMIAMLKFLFQNEGRHALAILKAYVGLLQWLWKSVEKKHTAKKSLTSLPHVLKRSIIWQYYVKGKKVYSAIKKNQEPE